MLSSKERTDLVNVARLYYEQGMTQDQVARRIGVSRPLVSKMLARAREVGIVHIEIRSATEGDAALLQALQAKFSLQGGLVVPEQAAAEKNAKAAADYLAGELLYERNIGLGWGYLLGASVALLAQQCARQQPGAVVPLIGKAHIPNKGYRVDELAEVLASACGKHAYRLGVPAFPDSMEQRQEFEATEAYAELAAVWQKLDAALVGIRDFPSVPDEATALRFGDSLKRQRAVGSFLSYYYNERGEFISGENDFAIRVPLGTLRRCPKIIGLALGAAPGAVLGALKTGLFTHLLVTETTARKILEC
ncbi:sugar-binding domain-containing protein [Phascolarctobacterium sp.]|uniref:sugar-binding transcriptional regulator n=1 Tax=Phascolarctobacterium sp. TaxID=2049039 RepID=UPI0027D94016|nr:sugar-binding domain-containing protein [uncultured Phascolarctobacterium sp.]